MTDEYKKQVMDKVDKEYENCFKNITRYTQKSNGKYSSEFMERTLIFNKSVEVEKIFDKVYELSMSNLKTQKLTNNKD